MRSKEDLYQLIQSLSKAEKRYFTLDAQKSGRQQSRYLELFQTLNRTEVYHEAALRKQFGRGLADDKARLYEAILRSMRDFRSAKSHSARIKEMLLDAKFLYERGLYEQCEQRLEAAKALAYEMGDTLAIIELNKEQRRVWKDTRARGYVDELHQLIREKETILEDLQQELYFLDTHDELLIDVLRLSRGRDQAQIEQLNRKYAGLLAREDQPPRSVQGILRYYQSLAIFYNLCHQTEKALTYYRHVIDTWNAYPKYKEEEFYRYVLDASNLLHLAFSNPRHYHEIPTLLQRIESEESTNTNEQKVLFEKVAIYRLVYHINSGDFRRLEHIIPDIEKGLRNYDLSISNELAILFNGAVLLFLSGHAAWCNEWLDRVIEKGRKTTLRQDSQDAARLLKLVNTIEGDEVEDIDNALRSTQRYFAQRDNQNSRDFGLQVIGYLRRYHTAPLSERRSILTEMLAWVNSLRNTAPRPPAGMDELLSLWGESRRDRQSISDLIRRRNILATS